MSIHRATITDGDDIHHFASLDGELFIEVERPVKDGEESALEAAFAGNGGDTLPMRISKGFLHRQGAAFWRTTS